MNIEILSGLALFAFVSSITPGPNNLMLMSSGANYGFARTVPHMLGVALGFTLMIVLVGLGVMQLFDAVPASYQILKVLSLAYLVYLAIKIARSDGKGTTASDNARPLTFLQAALFQWVNPKAWTMALTAISIYATSRSLTAVLLVALIFGAINLPCINAWVILGQKIQLILTNRSRLKCFNITMAVLLVASVIPAL